MSYVAEPEIYYEKKQSHWNLIPIKIPGFILQSSENFAQDLNSFLVDESMQRERTIAIEKERPFSFSWEGGLREMKEEFNGVKLQHYINTLRK